jgi:hypothetical protein
VPRPSLVVALAALAACASPLAHSPPAPSTWSYAIEPPANGATVLRVEATFGDARVALASDYARAAIRSFEMRTPAGYRAAPMNARGYSLDGCASPCSVRYALDFGTLADACGRLLCGMRVGDSFVTMAASWLVRPEGDAPIELRTRGAGPFALGMRKRADGVYTFRASELEESSYTAFGSMRLRRAAPIDIALLSRPLAMTDDAVATWVGEARGVISDFFGRFPTDTTLIVIPVAGDGVRFGTVSARTGASVALLVGDAMPASATHEDWVLVHELFHLGTPTFVGEGRWLEEGLATYYEPILRARAGWMTEEDLWTHFADQMPRGVHDADEAPDIEDRDDINSMYWGGALFCLVADVRIRERTRGAHSLDDVLRSVLADGGDVTRVWSVRDFLARGDAVTGTTVLRELRAEFARGDAVDLGKLEESLGVAWKGSGRAVLRADAPASALRTAISRR